jgi:hypothetical protein
MCKPIRDEQCVELVCLAVVEADHEFATVRTEAERMGSAWRKVPKVTFLHVCHIGSPFRVENCDSAVAVSHDGHSAA